MQVRLSFDVTLRQSQAVNLGPRVCDIIYDTTPRILAMEVLESVVEGELGVEGLRGCKGGEEGVLESQQEGGGMLRLTVTRDDVLVEFSDRVREWRAVAAVEGGGFQGLDPGAAEELEGPYTAVVEVPVPPYTPAIAERQEVQVKLLTKDRKDSSAPATFTYLPSKLKVEEVDTEKDYLTIAMEKEKEKKTVKAEDYLTMVATMAEKAEARPKVAKVGKVVREKRKVEELPTYMGEAAHRKARQREAVGMFFNKSSKYK